MLAKPEDLVIDKDKIYDIDSVCFGETARQWLGMPDNTDGATSSLFYGAQEWEGKMFKTDKEVALSRLDYLLEHGDYDQLEHAKSLGVTVE